jgi:hypothetical protein
MYAEGVRRSLELEPTPPSFQTPGCTRLQSCHLVLRTVLTLECINEICASATNDASQSGRCPYAVENHVCRL